MIRLCIFVEIRSNVVNYWLVYCDEDRWQIFKSRLSFMRLGKEIESLNFCTDIVKLRINSCTRCELMARNGVSRRYLRRIITERDVCFIITLANCINDNALLR